MGFLLEGRAVVGSSVEGLLVVGALEGTLVGLPVGISVGVLVGAFEGKDEGLCVG